MRKLKNLLITGVFLVLVLGTGYSQSSTDAELLENARNEVRDLTEDLNVNEDQETLLVRAIYSYKKSKMQINNSQDMDESEKNASLEDVKSSFKDNVRHALEDDEKQTKKFFEVYSEN